MNTTARINIVWVMLLLVISACDSPAPPSATADDAVIAVFGHEKVTVDEFYLYLKQINPLMQYANLPASEQQRLLDNYVEQRVLASAAREEQLDDNEEVAARLAFFEQRVLADAFRRHFADDIEVDEAEAKTYYEENKALFSVPAKYLIEHLVYKEPDKAIYAQGQLREGRPYLELAQHRQSDADLTFVERNRFAADILLPELRGPVSELEVGEVTELVYTNYGYHVVRLVEKEEATFNAFEDVRGQIIARLQQARAGQALQSLVEDAMQSGRVTTHLQKLRDAESL